MIGNNDYDMIMIGETANQSKREELRKNMDKSFTKKIGDHIPTRFALTVYYLEDIKCRKQ